MPDFHYHTGELIRDGDLVAVAGKRAVIDRVISERTRESQDFSCFETGGLLIKFEDGDLQLWPDVDEDLQFLKRACES